LVNVLLVARLLGHNLYGEYSLSIAPATIFVLFSGVGINTAITRFAAYHISRGEIEEAKRKTVNGIRFLMLLGAVLALISYLLSPFIASNFFHRPALVPYVQLSSLAVIGQIAYQCGIASLVGWGNSKRATTSYVVQALVKVSLAPALILLGFGVFGAVLAQVSSLLVAASLSILGLYFLKLRGGVTDSIENFASDIKSMIRFGMPSEIGNYFSSFAGQNYAVIILGVFASNAIVGYFQAANNVTAVISIFATSLILSLFAGFSTLHGQRGDTSQGFVLAVKYAAFAGTPIILFIIAASEPIIRVVYGVAYSPAAPLLALLAFSNIPLVFGQSVFAPYFNGIGKTRFTMFAMTADGATALVLAPILGYFFGVYGVIVALLASNSASGIVALYLAKRFLNTEINYYSSAMAFTASLLCAACAYALSIPNHSTSLFWNLIVLVLEFIVFFGLYLLIAPLLRVIRRDDVSRLEQASRGMGTLSRIISIILRIENRLAARGTSQVAATEATTSNES